MVNARLEARITNPVQGTSAGTVLLLLVVGSMLLMLGVLAVVLIGGLLFRAVNVH